MFSRAVKIEKVVHAKNETRSAPSLYAPVEAFHLSLDTPKSPGSARVHFISVHLILIFAQGLRHVLQTFQTECKSVVKFIEMR